MDAIDLTRTVEITDLDVSRADSPEREITAYAAVFDTPAEIRDHDGHYWETISRSAFDRTIAQKGTRFQVLFNHGRDIWGMPSERYSMPIGVPLEVSADSRGLLTRTRISKTPLGDEVLELARDGAVTGFSFRAAALGTKRLPVGDDGLPTLNRTEFALREYGPGTFVAYEDARVLAVRSRYLIDHLTDAERSELRRVLADTPSGSSHGPDDPADPGHVETPDLRAEALRAVRAFDLKDLT